MKSIFDLESPLMQMLTKVGDMILVNVLFILSCLPVVTAGAALAAMQKVTQDILHDNEKGLWKTYIRAFGSNFKQATISWLLIVLFLVSIACNYLLAGMFLEGFLESLAQVLLIVLAVIVAGVSVYLFPLMVRYDNTLRQHCYNAAMLTIIKLPRTVALVALTFSPVIILLLDLQVFINTLVFWLIIGFGFVSYLGSSLLAPVFKELEGNNVSLMK